MSWMKRPQGGTIPPVSEHQAYAAGQPYGNQQNMYPNYQGNPAVQPGVQQQQMWQMPQLQPQYNQQQYGQVYQQQNYNNSANQFYQTPAQMNQNYTNQNYENVQPNQGYQQNFYHNQPHLQQNVTQNEGSTESWEDNWGWGWEDSSKQNQKSHQVPSQITSLAPPIDNANLIEESFAPSNNWNWSMEEKRESTEPVLTEQGHATQPQQSEKIQDRRIVQNEPNNETVNNSAVPGPPNNAKQDIRNLSDREAVKELPNLAIGKRFHLENLTPQWSIESQMSQDSSDGPAHSDGKYRSENQSRNSSKDSPGPTTDSNFHYSQVSYGEVEARNNEWSSNVTEEPLMATDTLNNQRKESHHELLNSMQEMNLGNHELPSNGIINQNMETIKNNPPSGAHTSMSSTSTISSAGEQTHSFSAAPVSVNADLPPMQASNSTVSPSPLSAPTSLQQSVSQMPSYTQQSSSAPLPPPVGFSINPSQNPFKHAGSFSHKSNTKLPPSTSSGHSFPLQGVPLSSPSVVNQFVQQDHISVGYGVNLETTPDNSERPDQPQITGYRNITNTQQLPDNLEIAPQNDRNEYLQTAHLSTVDYGENTDFSRNMPPPTGPRRMGVGQQEVEYGQNLNISGDEPPPGLSRMVPGQQTESDNIYSQPGEDFMDRQIDGQPTDNTGRPYRQADGQQTPDDYNLPPSRTSDRRPIGLDRMVPGEPSNEQYNQYQSTNYSGANEERVVTGVDHDFSIPVDIGPSNIREQNLDGSDYSEPPPRNAARNIVGAREALASHTTTPDFNVTHDEQQREIIMEGENLQDLNIISGGDMSNVNVDSHKDHNTDRADSIEYPQDNSRKHSLNRVTSGEDSERDRNYKASPRKDREKNKPSRDLERETDGRYSRGDRKHDRDPDRRSGRDDRRSEKDRRDRDKNRESERRKREESPDARRQRRSTRSRKYETEDTDYYSDRERERRRYREGSYTSSKPPRPDDRDRRYEERERSRRYNTVERARRHEDERDGHSRRGDRNERHREGFERRYRDIDPARTYARRDDDRKKVVTFCGDAKSASAGDEDGTYSPGSRPGSREATVTDEDGEEPRRRHRERRRPREPHYYDGYGAGGYADEYEAQRRQYQYYERLRLTDPAAYMRIYKHLMDPAYAKYYAEAGYGALPGAGYEVRAEDRASVHSGRSSANGLKHADTFDGWRADASSLRGAPSLRTDLSDRELTTDMSLNLQLEESTVRSERMTPFKFATSHVKGVVGARSLVVARGGGGGGGVLLLPLHAALRHLPDVAELAAFPGPLVKGVSHKSRVVEYCVGRAAGAAGGAGGVDPLGRALVWQLLALLLRQNGVVVGSDIAELLMRNKAEFEYKTTAAPSHTSGHAERRDSAASRASRDDAASPPQLDRADHGGGEREASKPPVSEREALDRLRELLVYGNRQEAIEWAVQCGLWGHALQLAGDRRSRASVAARFVSALPPADPLHTLYHALAARAPPAATCVVDENWGDWRPHAAIILANTSAKPEQDRRTLVQLGDSLGARGLPYSAQFCYLAAGERVARHPLAPLQPPGDVPRPRLALLLADPRAPTLPRFATAEAIHATEVYEYALSLGQEYVLHELVVYKLLLSVRLVDAGLCERALGYVEQAARALAAAPRAHTPRLATALAALADRLKYADPALHDDGDGEGEGAGEDGSDASPRHQQQWLRDVQQLAATLQAEASQHATPTHATPAQTTPAHVTPAQTTPAHHAYEPPHDAQYAPQWGDQTLQQNMTTFPEPVEEAPDYAAQYHLQQQQQQHEQQYPGGADEWPRGEDAAQTYADPYWAPDGNYQYSEPSAWSGGAGATPTITMPGAAPARPALYNEYDDERSNGESHTDRDTDTPKSGKKEAKGGDEGRAGQAGRDAKGGGWLGGILTKLSLRAPNQMILPDDKNPTIVWDEQNKCWRDTNAPADGPAAPLAPPPAPSAPRGTSTPLQSPGAPPASGNLFQLQKGRNIKKAYVDVLGSSGARPAPAPADLPPAPPAAPPTHFFVPPPAPLQTSSVRDRVSRAARTSVPRARPPRVASSPVRLDVPSPACTPVHSPASSSESEIYDPMQMPGDGDFRSGI